jgi:hypothetical protein
MRELAQQLDVGAALGAAAGQRAQFAVESEQLHPGAQGGGEQVGVGNLALPDRARGAARQNNREREVQRYQSMGGMGQDPRQGVGPPQDRQRRPGHCRRAQQPDKLRLKE